MRWAVSEGMTTFVISWVNPDGKLAHKNFEDYLTEGTLAALDAIEKATGEPDANVIGYCLGGTLLAATLGHLAAQEGEARRQRDLHDLAHRLHRGRRDGGVHRRGRRSPRSSAR